MKRLGTLHRIVEVVELEPERDASFISLLVPLVIFFAFRRYFVQGLLAGSVK
jgi:ABC-type glycerol-3-phosphate transport system permease component